jgi:hypothetical protein
MLKLLMTLAVSYKSATLLNRTIFSRAKVLLIFVFSGLSSA